MQGFTYYLPTKIIFGEPAGEAVPRELDAISANRVLLVSDPGLAELGLVPYLVQAMAAAGFEVSVFTGVSSNPTTDEVAVGLNLAREKDIDALVALGGGSPIDVAKGIALLLANGGTYADYQWRGRPITVRSWPLIAVPTTAGTGSEVSKVAVLIDPDNPLKKGVLSPLMFPHAAVLDPQLTRDLPPWLTAATGMDTIVHAVEAYVGRRANAYTDHFALAALEAALVFLPQATADGADLEARSRMMLAALWAGTAMDHAGLGLVHALSGPLTNHLHLHHGLANSIILPYVIAYNLPAIPVERRRAFEALLDLPLEASDGAIVDGFRQLVTDLGLPTSLTELDCNLDSVPWESVAEETTRMVLIHNNPRPASADDCLHILEKMRQ
jgi:alcohol dehydrogenase